MTNKFRAEVDASEFGPGFTIRLDMEGQANLETEYGDFDFAQKVQIGLAVLSAKYIRSFLLVALRKDDDVISGPTGFLPPMPDVPLDVIGRKCLDVFTLFRYGKDAETWAADNAKAEKKAVPANPTKGTKA
jgi:hypothetical protein